MPPRPTLPRAGHRYRHRPAGHGRRDRIVLPSAERTPGYRPRCDLLACGQQKRDPGRGHRPRRQPRTGRREDRSAGRDTQRRSRPFRRDRELPLARCPDHRDVRPDALHPWRRRPKRREPRAPAVSGRKPIAVPSRTLWRAHGNSSARRNTPSPEPSPTMDWTTTTARSSWPASTSSSRASRSARPPPSSRAKASLHGRSWAAQLPPPRMPKGANRSAASRTSVGRTPRPRPVSTTKPTTKPPGTSTELNAVSGTTKTRSTRRNSATGSRPSLRDWAPTSATARSCCGVRS